MTSKDDIIDEGLDGSSAFDVEERPLQKRYSYIALEHIRAESNAYHSRWEAHPQSIFKAQHLIIVGANRDAMVTRIGVGNEDTRLNNAPIPALIFSPDLEHRRITRFEMPVAEVGNNIWLEHTGVLMYVVMGGYTIDSYPAVDISELARAFKQGEEPTSKESS